MDRQPDSREILANVNKAAFLACDPEIASPYEVADLGSMAIADLNKAIANHDGIGIALANAIVAGVHDAMLLREMFLDAVDLFSRFNAAMRPLGFDPLDGMPYSEYVEIVIGTRR